MNDRLMRDCMAVSSGTLASLTGERRYAELDEIHDAFIAWTGKALEGGRSFVNWMDAWQAYRADGVTIDTKGAGRRRRYYVRRGKDFAWETFPTEGHTEPMVLLVQFRHIAEARRWLEEGMKPRYVRGRVFFAPSITEAEEASGGWVNRCAMVHMVRV